MEKKSVYKSGKVKVSFYEGVLKLSELKKINPNELVLPLGIIIDKDYLNNKDFMDNEDLFFDMFLTYYCSPKKDKTFKTTYTQISIEKLVKLFFEDKIFLDKLILSDNNEKQISYITFSDNDFVLGFINKRKLFNRRETENISLKEMIYFSICEYLKSTNLEYFSEMKIPEVTLFELYDTEECISGFFDTKEEMDLYINASGSKGKTYKLDFYYHKDGIDNVVVETGENNEITCYKIIDEETCIIYLINGENVEYLSADLVYWPITDVLKTRGISFSKDKCKVK